VFDYMFVRNGYDRFRSVFFCIMRFHETVWAAFDVQSAESKEFQTTRRKRPILDRESFF